MLGAYCERVDLLVVLEMDDGVCGICGEDVDPFDFHVDHILPIACGGAHAYFNTQVSHPECNVRKHVKSDAPPLPYTPLGRRSDRAMAASLVVRDLLAEGLTYQEVAERLGVNVDQIRWRVTFLRNKGVPVITRKRGRRNRPNRNGRPGSSRFRGVSWHSRDHAWQASLTVDGRRHYLGMFATEDDAAQAVTDFNTTKEALPA